MSTKNFHLHFFLKASIALIGVYLLFYILILGKNIFIPLVLAAILASALISTKKFFDAQLKLPVIFSIIFSGIVWVGVLYAFARIINSNVQTIIAESASYEQKIGLILDQLAAMVGVEEISFSNIIQTIDIPGLATSVGGALTSLIASTGTILIYTAFILAEQNFVHKKIETLLKLSSDSSSFSKLLTKISQDIKSYFVIHSSFSVLTGMGTYIICLILGLEFGAFWGLLAFLLNFIPTIGSMLAAAIPVIFSLVQFGAEGMWVFVIALMILLFALQFIIGNVIEPKFLGNRLNLSPLVILLSLTFWGSIWGVVGMFLSIPIMVMINIICSHFPETRWIHVMLSASGEIKK